MVTPLLTQWSNCCLVLRHWYLDRLVYPIIPSFTHFNFGSVYLELDVIWIDSMTQQGLTLRCAHMPVGHADLVSGHINCCGYVPVRASGFSVWACTYFPSSVHNLYRACLNIGWARENFCRACRLSDPRARRSCKPKKTPGGGGALRPKKGRGEGSVGWIFTPTGVSAGWILPPTGVSNFHKMTPK